MDLNAQKEQFNRAWVGAVASVAGFATYRPEPDTDSVDLGVCSDELHMRPRLEMQLKCSETIVLGQDPISYALPIKNYEELVGDNFQVPRILVLLQVPRNLHQWMECRAEEMLLRNTAWWASLRTLSSSSNTTSVTVHVPRAQAFTPSELTRLMEMIAGGQKP